MEDLSKEEFEQLLAVYRDQSIEIVNSMDQALLAFEANPEDPEAIGDLRRAAHTLKGDSYCIGFNQIAEIAHRMEDLFDSLLTENKQLAGSVADLILEALEGIRNALSGERVADIDEEDARTFTEKLSRKDLADKGNGSAVQVKGFSNEAGAAPGSPPLGRKSEFVRVEAAKIDALLSLAGEMVIARSAINQVFPELERSMPKSEVAGRIIGVSGRIGKLIGEF